MRLKNFITLAVLVTSCLVLPACSDNDEVRQPSDIVGVWSMSEDSYLDFRENNTIKNLKIEEQDGESIGIITDDVYFYEPGYNLVVYITASQTANVYQIIKMTDSQLTWCWVKDITDDYEGDTNIGSIIGNIIKEAQQGFQLNPNKYQTFKKISENSFLEILENLDLLDMW